jgi:hypothetical protein
MRDAWRHLREQLSIRYRALQGHPPILVYSMGKVGSSAILQYLHHLALPNPVYQVHLLSDEWTRAFEKYFASLSPPIAPEHMETSRLLRQEWGRWFRAKWRIITLVREPITVRVSGFFQNVNAFHPEFIRGDGSLNIERTMAFLKDTLAKYLESQQLIDVYFRDWVEAEFRTALNVDLLAHPFDHERGFMIVRRPHCEVLVIRFESLSDCFGAAMGQFLDLKDPGQPERQNVSSEKEHGEAYRYVLEHLRIPRDVCKGIYALPSVRHFYTAPMIEGFINRWADDEPGGTPPRAPRCGRREAELA